MWIKTVHEQTKYNRHIINNPPINLDFVLTFDKSTYKIYPDNDGLPSIKFYTVNYNGLSSSNVCICAEWVFEDEEKRNKEYLRLLTYIL